MTKVVHCRGDTKSEGKYIYVGRGSIWGNPFPIGQHPHFYTRPQVIALHAEWFPQQRHLMARVRELRGCTLACWCEEGQQCHGHTLKFYADMAKFELIKGDALHPRQTLRWNLIAHIVNNVPAFGGEGSFASQMGRQWPETKRHYFDWAKSSTFKMGAVEIQVISPEKRIAVAHMLAQDGLPGSSNPHPLRYDYLKNCLTYLSRLAEEMDADLHMPKIGTGYGRGSWPAVATLIQKVITDKVDVFVYVKK